MKRFLKIVSLMLTMSLLMNGCAGETAETEKKRDIKVKLNETIDADSKWIDSSIEGAIDANTPTNPKDDFYTYVNKEYILEKTLELDEDNHEKNFLLDGQEIIEKRLKSIIFETEDPDAYTENKIGYDQTEVEHDRELVVQFTQVAGDWDLRNKAGVEPLKEYLAKIDRINTLEDLSEYMASPFVANFSGIQLITLSNDQTLNDPANNHIGIEPYNKYVLLSSDPYFKYGFLNGMQSSAIKQMLTDILVKAGYSEREARKMLKNTFKLEAKLADSSRGMTTKDYTEREKYSSMEEIKALFGDYPIEDIIKAYGLVNPEGYAVYFPQFVKGVTKLYKESNLSMLKDFYRVQTVLAMAPLLDRESFDAYMSCFGADTNKDITKDGDTRDMESNDKELDILLNQFAYRYMNEPLDAVYVSRYCSSEQKESLTELVHEIIKYYSAMIDTEEWLSEETRELTKEKLGAMKLNILYPDSYPSYMDVEFNDGDTLPDMVCKLSLHIVNQDMKKVLKPHETGFTQMSTTTMNAYYFALDNSVNILAGMLTPEHMYDINDPVEVRLARLGTIVGHEISHGFDDKGILFDKDGKENSWWATDDTVAFSRRSNKLKNYYSALIPFPGAKKYSGSFVSSEAIADLGGVKCMLGIGKDIEGFDYDLFFRSYAGLWRSACTYEVESMRAVGDEHPLAMLRVNVVVQQFDEFYTTYDVKKGDGMYLDPDKRINVW